MWNASYELMFLRMCDFYMLCRLFVPCSSFLISVCMFIVSKALLISSATVIVRAGGVILLNAYATVFFYCV